MNLSQVSFYYLDKIIYYGYIICKIKDRYVAIGNHRDAWSFGALDPSSGSSVMLEVSRALANLKKTKKWKPKRSIM